jgi:hypothetical protein
VPHPLDRRDFLRAALGTAGFLSVAGCGGGGSVSSSPSSPAAVAQPPAEAVSQPPGAKDALIPIDAAQMAAIRSRPETFLGAYSALGSGTSSAAFVRSKLGAQFASLSDAGCLTTFATVIASDCAPSGETSLDPMAASLAQLLSSPALACGHFCKLATLLSLLGHPELIPPDADPGAPPKPTLHFMVWLANVPLGTGLHSQLLLANVLDNAYLLLDPMYAVALRIPFVGAGPSADLTVIENAAVMLKTPIPQDNLTLLSPGPTAGLPPMLPALMGGALGPMYVLHDALYGAEGWDLRIGQIFDHLGSPAPA